MAREKVIQQTGEILSPLGNFGERLNDTIDVLTWCGGLENLGMVKDKFMFGSSRLVQEEKDLIGKTFDFFALARGIVLDEELFPLLQEPAGSLVGCMGALGGAKTTVMEAVAKALNTENVERENYLNNPFWSGGFTAGVLGKETHFFFSSMTSDMRALRRAGVSVSDTCTLTDALMWASWHHKIGRFGPKEYETYQRLVKLLKPIIPRPDLIVALFPDSIDHLKEGVLRRVADDQARKDAGEEEFAAPDDQALATQIGILRHLIREVPSQWGVPVFPRVVNPIAVYEDSSVKEECVSQIIGKMKSLNLLK